MSNTSEDGIMKTVPQALRAIERFVFGSRWLLLPLMAGLTVALAFYVGKFFIDLYGLIISAFRSDTEQVRVMLLGLVDTAMVANLLVMVTLGGYQIFIRRPSTLTADQRPQFLDHMDSGIQKVKIALSISGIMLVQILKDFVNIESVDWTLIVHRSMLLGLGLVAALVMAVIWRVMHPGHETEKHNETKGEIHE